LFVRSDSQYKTWNDVLRAEKANPGKLNVATAGKDSMDEMTVKYLRSKGINLEGVPYSLPGQRYAAAIGGHVDFLYEQAGDIKGQLEAKMLRPILFFTAKRSAAFSDVAASGEFGYELALTQFRAVVTRTGIDLARLDALASAMERYARSDDFNAYLREQLAAPDSYIPAAQAQVFLRSEFESMRRFAKSSR
jgi:tripartite-type tricarboxylate transporter receptor subunit TctC